MRLKDKKYLLYYNIYLILKSFISLTFLSSDNFENIFSRTRTIVVFAVVFVFALLFALNILFFSNIHIFIYARARDWNILHCRFYGASRGEEKEMGKKGDGPVLSSNAPSLQFSRVITRVASVPWFWNCSFLSHDLKRGSRRRLAHIPRARVHAWIDDEART